MTEYFKLIPYDPTINSKLSVIRDRQDREPILLSILGWQRILPNKVAIPLINPALDNLCLIEVAISVTQLLKQYKINDKIYNRVLRSNPIALSKQLKEKALYIMESAPCKVFVDQFSVYMKIQTQNKRLRFLSEAGKFQTLITEHLVQVQPFNSVVKINFSSFTHQFLRFYCDSLKRTHKFRSSHCFCIFNSKMDQDLFLVSISESFKQFTVTPGQIKIVGNVVSTPRNDKQMKKDGSASSLTSINKSRQKNRQKVKISQRLNLKKSCTKLNSNKGGNLKKQCLNVFEDDNFTQDFNSKGTQQSSVLKQSDASMDLRGSFEELEKHNVHQEEDKLSNHSFRQKQSKVKPDEVNQENKHLRNENTRLRKQLESMSQIVKEAVAVKKKYLNAVEELNRLENQRIAIVKDKMRFESAYYDQMKETERLRKEVEMLKTKPNDPRAI